ncbi:unnamed protein product [Laminaria digitata]
MLYVGSLNSGIVGNCFRRVGMYGHETYARGLSVFKFVLYCQSVDRVHTVVVCRNELVYCVCCNVLGHLSPINPAPSYHEGALERAVPQRCMCGMLINSRETRCSFTPEPDCWCC